MTDIVEKLRVAAVETFALPIATVMDSAADEIERLRMTVRAFELTGDRRRVSGGSSPVDIKSAFISKKTLTAVLEALRSNWFIATDEDEDNNEDVIAATKMLEAEIATQNNAVPAAGSDGSNSDGNRVRASDPPTGNTTMQFTHGDDITVRLTRWCEQPVDRTATQELMDEAAREIERLRNGGACPHVRGIVTQHCSLNFTLTDAERQAIQKALKWALTLRDTGLTADSLRSILERLK